MDALEKIKAKNVAQAKAWEAVRQIGIDDGFMLLQLSARKWCVVYREACGGLLFSDGTGNRFSVPTGIIRHTGSWTTCRNWIQNNVAPVPKEIYDGIL